MSESHTILLVDDDPEIVRAADLRLQAAGYETLTAHDGRAGVLSALDSHPDLIVMDVRMPQMDGFAALEELQRHPDTQDIPVMMLSASVRDQQAALDAGARHFLRKPYRGDTLVEAVGTIIARQRNVDRATEATPVASSQP